MYTRTFLRAQLDLDVFLPARVRAFFRSTCVMYGLLRLANRYVPPSEGKFCKYMYRSVGRVVSALKKSDVDQVLSRKRRK